MSVPDASRAKRAAAGRMTREAWVEAGIAALMEEGIANVKIQVMARTLAVSRSSFYWFFADLQELHRELLEYWLRKNTNPIIERALRPAPKTERSGDTGFFLSGIFGGLLSGMFGISGPPLIFYFYRQPLTLVQIRCALILLFAVTASIRTLYSAFAGQLPASMIWQAAVALPVVTFATLFARRYPPPLSSVTTRRLAFLTLILLGTHLMVSALMEMA